MRIAAVRYINALPLIFGLRKNPAVTLSYETPSDCYEKLIRAEVDVGLIPVIGTQTNPTIRGVRGLGIASSERSESVYVFAKKSLDRIQSVATASGSLTSVMLFRILLQQKYCNAPRLVSQPIENIHQTLREYDAVLVIGDAAILTEKTDYDHYDLATEWYSLTGLPFVFAIWAANRVLSDFEQHVLQQAYQQATQNWEEIYREAQGILNVNRRFLKRYYNVNLRYRLRKSDYEGMLKFFSSAADLGLIEYVRKDIWM